MATEVKLPEVGEGISSGTVVAVLVKVGDTITIDQPLIEFETDKAVVEVPSTAAGVVRSVDVQENSVAKIGQTIVTVEEGASAADAADAPTEEPSDASPSIDAASPQPEPTAPAQQAADDARPAAPAARAADAVSQSTQDESAGVPAGGGAAGDRTTEDYGRVPAAPSVRRLARELGVDIRDVHGGGILGRISAADVRSFAEGGVPASAQAPARPASLPDFSRWGEVERAPMSGIRRATVRTMNTAWSTIPMVTQFDKADGTDFEALRQRYKKQVEAAGAKLTPTAMLLKVVAAALKKFPDFNASIDLTADEIVHKRYVNIGVAVDTDAGLLVPVIKNADRKGILQLATELGELADKARSRKLSLDDMQGGNFSVSNLGGLGGTAFTPIVNPPEVAILGVSRSAMEPVYDEASGEFNARLMLPLSLTYDHRLIDGAAAVRFLRWICDAIEEPFLMALEG